jgi:hypothetical protein
MPLVDRQQIQQLLDGMRRETTPAARLDSARRLFAQLNYDAARKPLPLELPKEIKRQIVGSPTAIATAGGNTGF